ncbi:MAG: hypothetical protein QOH31_4768 [Verrucomicrobiota bacterium]|jgi:hypothetical protein
MSLTSVGICGRKAGLKGHENLAQEPGWAQPRGDSPVGAEETDVY